MLTLDFAGHHPRGAVGLVCLGLALFGGGWLSWLGVGLAFLLFVVPAAWDHLGGKARAALVGVPAVVVAAAAVSPWVAVGVLASGISAGGWWALRRLRRWWRWEREERPHHEEYVLPLHLALGRGKALGWDPTTTPPERYIDVPKDLLADERGITLSVAPGPLPTDHAQAAIVSTVRDKLGLGPHRAQWVWRGTHQYLVIKAKERSVPELVEFDESFRALLEKTPAHKKLVGRGVGDRPVYIDQIADNPHMLITATTGFGKTTALGIMAADELHKGGEVIVLDPKFGSMRWLYGLPGVTYARTIDVQHDTLLALAGELGRRREVLGETPWDEEPVFPRMFVLIEETSSLIEDLTDHWVELRAQLKAQAKEDGTGYVPPTKSPALKGYRQGLKMGRQLGIFFVVVDQRGEARDVGGSLARVNLGNVLLGWPTQATWKMHAPQHPFVPHDSRAGHGHISRGNTLTEVQFVRASTVQLREWATSGKAPSAVLSHAPRTSSTSGDGGGHVLGQRTLRAVPDLDEPDDEATTVSLRNAASDTGPDGGLLPVKLATLQRYARPDRRRRNGFPAPVGVDPASSAQLFDVEQLLAWSRNRPSDDRRRRAEEGG